MKKSKIILALMLFSFSFTSAQNPYKIFGVEGREILTEQERNGEATVVLVSTDTLNGCKLIVFDFKEMKYFLYNMEGLEIKRGDINLMIPKRWLSTDPLESKYPGLTPYNFVSNNPIILIDRDGKKYEFADDASKEQYQKMYDAASDDVKSRYDLLDKSEIIYNVNVNAVFDKNGLNGQTYFDFDKDRVNVFVNTNTENKIGTLGDELQTAFQFETGKVGFVTGERTLGYDMEDEVETKLAHIEAVDLYNKKYGTSLEYAPSLKKFKEAYAKGNEAVEAYFNSDKNALNYRFDPRGNKMGVRISGLGDYSYIVLVKAVQGNQFSGFAYTQGGKLILFKK